MRSDGGNAERPPYSAVPLLLSPQGPLLPALNISQNRKGTEQLLLGPLHPHTWGRGESHSQRIPDFDVQRQAESDKRARLGMPPPLHPRFSAWGGRDTRETLKQDRQWEEGEAKDPNHRRS